jgi:hypothetical protein
MDAEVRFRLVGRRGPAQKTRRFGPWQKLVRSFGLFVSIGAEDETQSPWRPDLFVVQSEGPQNNQACSRGSTAQQRTPEKTKTQFASWQGGLRGCARLGAMVSYRRVAAATLE